MEKLELTRGARIAVPVPGAQSYGGEGGDHREKESTEKRKIAMKMITCRRDR
jgi:hypothetical protein